MPTIDEILNISKTHEQLFASQRELRREYLSRHPTTMVVLECIDGRVKFRACTDTLPGIITPLRSPGGKANACWPAFKSQLKTWFDSPHFKLFIATFHFSGSDNAHLGCAAVNKDERKARQIVDDLAGQLNRIYAATPLYAIVIGINTDDGSLVLRSAVGNREVDTTTLVDKTTKEVGEILYELYPECPRQIRLDLVPIVMRNSQLIQVQPKNDADLDHQETMIGIAGGLGSFSWLDKDMGLIVSTIHMGELERSLVTAATVLSNNLEKWSKNPSQQHMLERGVILMSCVPYWTDSRSDVMQAEEEAQYYQQTALDILTPKFPELVRRLSLLTATIDPGTRHLTVLSEDWGYNGPL